ncbi:hypothetical protein KI387_038769, partial [Taxus chinensis]
MENTDLKEDQAPESVSVLEEKVITEKSDEDRDRVITVEEKSVNVQNGKTEVKDVKADKDGAAEDPNLDVPVEEKYYEPIFDGTENPPSESDLAVQGTTAWPEKATALKNYVVERSAVVGNVIRRCLSGKKEDIDQKNVDPEGNAATDDEEDKKTNLFKDWNAWNPLTLVKNSLEGNAEAKRFQGQEMALQALRTPELASKGRIILFSCSESSDCRVARSLLRQKGLRFIEINTDIYPGRKVELEKKTGSPSVPKIFFNEVCLGGVREVTAMDKTGELDEKIKGLIETEAPSEAPLPPSVEEEDFGNSGMVDEFENVVTNLREHVVIKDRFYKMRMFSRCFVGSEAVDFLAEDQLLEREEAVDFGRKLAAKHFFHHVLDENTFDDGNHLYRFFEHDPAISKCFNFSGRTNDMKPKPATEVAAKLRILTLAIYAAYISDNGKHVDYRSISASAEFVRYLKVIEDLHRIDLHDFSREEKLAFFINLYNMMAIHAIVMWGQPNGPLERRKLFGDFKYVIGGYPYSLSAIQNGVLRGNQRPPYTLTKPFGLKDKRLKVALPIPEPLVHFSLVCGSKSSPPFICYSPASIDEELRLAARIFFNDGGFLIDMDTNTASLSKIMK